MPIRHLIPLCMIMVVSCYCLARQLSDWLHPVAVATSPSDSGPTASSGRVPLHVLGFALRDQDNQTVKGTDLLGHVWIADFIFTECGGSCPILNRCVVDMEKKPELGKVSFISFSVSPEDGPKTLKKYLARGYADADQSRWRLLAADQQDFPRLAVELGLARDVSSVRNGFILLDPQFFLVDASGRITGRYDGTSAADVARLEADAARLASIIGNANIPPPSGNSGKQ